LLHLGGFAQRALDFGGLLLKQGWDGLADQESEAGG
jgi:hypothetical protein